MAQKITVLSQISGLSNEGGKTLMGRGKWPFHLMHHEVDASRIRIDYDKDSRSGYFRFECRKCKDEMPLTGIWIDSEGRLILNCRCEKCQYTDVRKMDAGDKPYVIVDSGIPVYTSDRKEGP